MNGARRLGITNF